MKPNQRPLVVILSLLLITTSTLTFAAPSSNSEQKEPLGIVLYNQLKIDHAILELEREAADGNSESQYYLGEALRKKNRFMTPEAQHWYESAAEKNNVYAIIQLARAKNDLCTKIGNCPPSKKTQAEWFELANELVLPKAQKGDPESLYLMYEITLNREWLEKSANAGYPTAQYWMAVSERQGEGFFLIPGKREASIKKWLLLSSEGGHPKAMMDYLQILFEEGDVVGMRHWLETAAATGDQAAISNYGAYIAHTPDKIGYPLDLVKGYALFTLLKELEDSGGIGRYVERKSEEIREKMTSEQTEKSLEVAKDWKATHPPLSFFPDKLGN
ncbi:tetratricopeptide repeat protein [Pseudomonas sp. HMWF021]|uniref:tetratricopeptide repeat protein n=1 Tax=Pseudomonas sp. HMWF021 TaxID=2056857 RepID=UPI000D3A2A13|nr:sel1 repeat family protein [Pseudomonas sp. HMWF021]PTT32065.1 sel1 repeat family protein [Pseudomonas sp. HMWF021]